MGCAAFVGAALAFPAGLMLGAREPGRAAPPNSLHANAPPAATSRRFYSPDIHSDPFVRGQWQKLVEELEAQCRRTGERCKEAKAARRSLDQKW